MRYRKLPRKGNFDYSSEGLYFITTVTKNRKDWFGEIINEEMKLNSYGQILKQCWFDLPNHYFNCVLDEMIIMPNHLHGIIRIDNHHLVGIGFKPIPTKKHGLSEFMRALKTFSSKQINKQSKHHFSWQASFHDRIIRNEKEYINIKNYIMNNPQNWNLDKNNQ